MFSTVNIFYSYLSDLRPSLSWPTRSALTVSWGNSLWAFVRLPLPRGSFFKVFLWSYDNAGNLLIFCSLNVNGVWHFTPDTRDSYNSIVSAASMKRPLPAYRDANHDLTPDTERILRNYETVRRKHLYRRNRNRDFDRMFPMNRQLNMFAGCHTYPLH